MNPYLKIDFRYNPGYGLPCAAELSLHLPTDQEELTEEGECCIHSNWRSYSHKLFNEQLTDTWGYPADDDKTRFKVVSLRSKDWDSLIMLAEKEKTTAKNTLKLVKQENAEQKLTIPDGYVIFLD